MKDYGTWKFDQGTAKDWWSLWTRGRDPKEVTLIAVSKTKPIEMIEEAIDAGKTQFGENKAQEMKEKYEALPKNLNGISSDIYRRIK